MRNELRPPIVYHFMAKEEDGFAAGIAGCCFVAIAVILLLLALIQ